MIQNSTAFLFYTLGVSSYLCPKNIFKVRKFHGGWPCDVLGIVKEAPEEKEKLLFEKMMKALLVSRFAILEIRDPSHADWILKQLLEKRLAKRFLIFSEELNPPVESSMFLQTFPLKQFIQAENPSKILAKKKKLWGDLQVWLKKDSV